MNELSKSMPEDYGAVLAQLKQRIRDAQNEALRVVNRQLVSLYWDIGATIVQRQEGDSWGKSVVQRLSADLQTEFPGIRGFSVQNLWYMRQFYLEYQQNEKLQPLVGEIGWSHNLQIFQRCKDLVEREFYLRMTRALFGGGLSVEQEQHDIFP